MKIIIFFALLLCAGIMFECLIGNLHKGGEYLILVPLNIVTIFGYSLLAFKEIIE